MRGLRHESQMHMVDGRYNPAYAGTTVSRGYQCLSSAIQPRVCGDYETIRHLWKPLGDTTPRMRGLREGNTIGCGSYRYNPAYAGTTLFEKLNKESWEIQPRVCGDYRGETQEKRENQDTTPRMRGLLRQAVHVIKQCRYNPAYAGTTALYIWCPGAQADTTPRMRGLLDERHAMRERRRYNPRVCGDYSRGYLTLAPF